MLISTLRELVKIYPVSASQSNVEKLCQYAAKTFTEVGLITKLLNYNGVHSLYASTTNEKHSRLLLQAHIDVVPGKEQVFKVTNDKLFGRGVYDMLYATACYIEIMKELKDQLSNLDIAIMLSGDEELGGYNGVAKFLQDDYTADVCILPDAGEGFGTLNVGAKGSLTYELRVNGTAHHGSRPWEGDGAAGKLVKLLSKAEQIFDASSRDNSTMTVARIQAGDAENRGPAVAACTLDIRYKSQTDRNRIESEMTKLMTKYDTTVLELKNGDDYQLDLNNKDVRRFMDMYERAVGGPIKLTRAHGSSDARFFSALNIPVIMLRPDGGGAHGDEEWISKDSLEKFYDLLKAYVMDIAVVE